MVPFFSMIFDPFLIDFLFNFFPDLKKILIFFLIFSNFLDQFSLFFDFFQFIFLDFLNFFLKICF